ncbi:exodeoxyribonuclease V subunit alpha [Enterobacteriaceae endosymbiont of Donacia cincticornis]|uniref:exodeoxyribonuclease V subunit alpha n=1 Tax=Enterobacteriaceae endosymbiont of Donacia cincticornis TaxID=2675773 RepID=UPI001449A00D|nr:exodeoxyribonuclease V subunit alpha [Enterobacteriaceae endosymbiont of Donacia cincticornis]QJC36269.1 exodeoxyribonuclease V subunit alpha [Enterobacteriaceae endosymbiont of Donacia cincticornis]
MYLFLEKLCKIKIIRLIDLYLASILTNKKKDLLMFAIALLSNYVGKGNICLPISKLYLNIDIKKKKNNSILKKIKEINKIKNWKEILSSYKDIVSNGKKNTPIILINNHLYLHKMWHEENIIVKNFLNNNFTFVEPKKIKKILKFLCKKKDFIQQQAICSALTHKISIITGSPGTGKTSIISKIIFAFIKIFDKRLKIKIVATTGKAAVRLTQSMNFFFKNISDKIISKEKQKNIPKKATTIHYLLKMKIYTKEIKFNYFNKLNIDLLIIDESSMIDFSLMSIILNILSKKTKLVLLGDEYQLPSIEYGNLFKDLCYFKKFYFTEKYFLWLSSIIEYQYKSQDIKKFFFRNFITVLKYNFRYSINSGINQLALNVKNGYVEKIKKIFLLKRYNDIKYCNITNINQYKLMISSFIKEYKKYFIYLQKYQIYDKNIFYKFNNYQIICAIKYGLFGTKKINSIIEKELLNNKIITIPSLEKNWYIGRPIIITKNDNYLNLFNGDIGITFLDKKDQKLKIKFFLFNDKQKIMCIENLPSYEIAYAITAHKSQGSEFKNVALILPNKFYSILTRELIYTAITRTKKKITIYSNKNIFYKAIKSKIIRFSNMKNKIINHI